MTRFPAYHIHEGTKFPFPISVVLEDGASLLDYLAVEATLALLTGSNITAKSAVQEWFYLEGALNPNSSDKLAHHNKLISIEGRIVHSHFDLKMPAFDMVRQAMEGKVEAYFASVSAISIFPTYWAGYHKARQKKEISALSQDEQRSALIAKHGSNCVFLIAAKSTKTLSKGELGVLGKDKHSNEVGFQSVAGNFYPIYKPEHLKRVVPVQYPSSAAPLIAHVKFMFETLTPVEHSAYYAQFYERLLNSPKTELKELVTFTINQCLKRSPACKLKIVWEEILNTEGKPLSLPTFDTGSSRFGYNARPTYLREAASKSRYDWPVYAYRL